MADPRIPQPPIWEQERLIDIDAFGFGLHMLEDSTKAPIGSARVMTNMMITDQGGISKRPGTQLLGTNNTNAHGVHGLFNFKKSGGTEIPVKAYDTELEYYHPTLKVWTRLMNSFTSDSEFGFKEHLVNTDNVDYVYYGNRTEAYSRWRGITAKTTVALTGAETILTVDSTLDPNVYDSGTIPSQADSGTSTATSATTLTDSTKNWNNGAQQWAGFILKITSGAQSGVTTTISANTTTVLTFGAITDPGAGCTYQILSISQTVLYDSTKTWAVSQWIHFYVRWTSGAQSGKITQITQTGSNFLNFNSVATAPVVGDTYEIRMAIFPSSGTLMLNGVQNLYSNIPTDATLTITAPGIVVPISSPVTIIPETFPADPKGNRLETLYTRMIVGNVRSALSYNSSGTLGGNVSTRSWYYSKGGTNKTADASDFRFTATRVAGEGGIESIAYGGGDITDVVNSEDQVYIFTPTYIEGAKFTQDTNDLPQRQQLKTGLGSVNKAIKTRDDIYFMTPDNQFTSIGRVKLKDTFPQHLNAGLPIKRLLDTMDFTKTKGIEYKQRLLVNGKNATTDSNNNRVLVYNTQTKSFEGLWELNAFGFMIFNNLLHYGDVNSPNAYQMFIGANDTNGTTSYPITSTWKSNWINLTPRRRFVPKSDFAMQSVDTFAVEGYIRGGTNLTFELYKDFSDVAALSFKFSGTETGFVDGSFLSVFLGDTPLATEPLAMFGQPNLSGDIHFSFIVYFPDIYSNFFSLGVLNTGLDQYFEISRLGVGVTQDPIYSSSRIKSL